MKPKAGQGKNTKLPCTSLHCGTYAEPDTLQGLLGTARAVWAPAYYVRGSGEPFAPITKDAKKWKSERAANDFSPIKIPAKNSHRGVDSRFRKLNNILSSFCPKAL